MDQEIYTDWNAQSRDIQEKQRLLRDRVLLLGKTLVEERNKTFSEMQEMKKTLIELKDETSQIKAFLQRISENLANTARKEELMILKRQFDLFRK